MNPLQTLIDYAKKEHLRLLIEIDNSGYTVLYCDKTEKRNFLKQIRLNKIKTRIVIKTHGYDIEFPEEPTIAELSYRMGKVMKVFRKEREIHTYFNVSPQLLFNFIVVDFPESERFDLIIKLKGFYFDDVKKLKKFMKNRKIKTYINRDRNTFIIYYKGVE